MKRLNREDLNTPEYFDKLLQGRMGLPKADKERFNLLLKEYKGGRLLDLGVQTSPMALNKDNSWVLDFSQETIKWWRKTYPQVQSVLSNALDTPFKDNFFDYVVAGELIEHIEKPKELVKEAFRILKVGGWFALSTPLDEENNPLSPEHLWSFQEKDIENLLKPYGSVKTQIWEQNNHKYIIALCQKK